MNKSILIYLASIFFLIACEEKDHFKIEIKTPETEIKLNSKLEFEVTPITGKSIDSISYSFQSKKYSGKAKNIITLNQLLLGKHELKIDIYAEGEVFQSTKAIKIFNDKPPKIYSFEVVNTYPHSITSYTQGLEFKGDSLFESIGQYGKSKLLQVELETGNILREHKLDNQYFAEGITIVNDKIIQLTWKEGVGIIYNADTFKEEDKFRYNKSKEGWGLCHDDNYIYKSDGTDKIWRLNPETLAEIDYIQPTTHKSISEKLNELEYVNGKIYANTYQKDGVAVINPENGAIEAVIDFRPLKKQVEQHKDLDVLNGIAYHKKSQSLYVTGKNWNKLFEVKILEK